MKNWLNRSELVLSHNNPQAKFQFFFWGFWQKILLGVFVYNSQMQNNWQLHYLMTLLNEYQPRPNVSKIELNCAFKDYDQGIALVEFYFAGTRGFQINLDGTYTYLTDVHTEDSYSVEVHHIGPLLVDGWEDGDGDSVKAICLHQTEEAVDGSKKWRFVEGEFIEINSESEDADTTNVLQIKDVFASSTQYPCMPRYSHFYPAFEEELLSEGFALIEPDPSCKRMYDFFKKTGMPSYVELIEGFSISTEPILESSKVYEKLTEALGGKDRDVITELIWGDQIPRNYTLFKVSEFGS